MISDKQKKILAFPFTRYDALICDGAIRSGKTSIMTVSFVDWAMREFNNCNFAICGKTVGSAIKNIVTPYIFMDYAKSKYKIKFTRSDNKMLVHWGKRTNTFYLYGGKDESSYMLIQGITLAGVLLDEVALMARSFVEQALARCSVTGSKYWFNCNPASPTHWFNNEWILKADDKNALHLHFRLQDNPSLTDAVIERYENLYTGVFHDRYIKGLWVSAEGVIYKQFADNTTDYLIDAPPDDIMFCNIGFDFGGNGSAHAGICTGLSKGLQKVVVLAEYYRKEIITPTQLENDFCNFVLQCQQKFNVYDAYLDSAEQVLIKGIKSAVIREHIPINIHNARKSEILGRIRFFNSIMSQHRFYIMRDCKHAIKALQSAVWDSKKQNDVRLDDGNYNIDSLDAMEYSTEKYMLQILQTGGINGYSNKQ